MPAYFSPVHISICGREVQVISRNLRFCFSMFVCVFFVIVIYLESCDSMNLYAFYIFIYLFLCIYIYINTNSINVINVRVLVYHIFIIFVQQMRVLKKPDQRFISIEASILSISMHIEPILFINRNINIKMYTST